MTSLQGEGAEGTQFCLSGRSSGATSSLLQQELCFNKTNFWLPVARWSPGGAGWSKAQGGWSASQDKWGLERKPGQVGALADPREAVAGAAAAGPDLHRGDRTRCVFFFFWGGCWS